jgi:hypothetical protein
MTSDENNDKSYRVNASQFILPANYAAVGIRLW